MMTSENNANRMLTKVSVFSFCAERGSRHVHSVGALIVLCTGLVACSYRASDKSVLHARTTASESVAVAPDKPRANVPGMQPARTFPSTEMARGRETPNAPTARATSGGGMEKRIKPSIQRVVGDASVFLSPSTTADDAVISEADHVDTNNVAPSVIQPAEAIASEGKTIFISPWVWLLAIAAGGIGFGLARYRQSRGAIPREKADSADELCAQDSSLQVWQEDVQAVPSSVPEYDMPMMIEAVALTVDGDTLSGPANAGAGPIPFSLLEWSYQRPDYEGREHWEATAPVDFLPASLAAQAVQEANESSFNAEAEVMEDVRSYEESESATVPALAFSSDPLSQLFDQLENIALREPGDVPVLLIERGSALPEVTNTTSEPVPSEMLQAWERTLRMALPDAQALTLPWLLVSTLLLRADDAGNREAETLYAEAEEWIELSMAADHEWAASWQARRIDIDLCRAKRQKGAARLLSLRAMQSHYAQEIKQGAPPVLFAWIDVLMFWAQCQFGDAALTRYAEAEAICLGLIELPTSIDAAQRRRAEILRQRATIEEGGARLNSLDTAQALVDALYERVPSADNALAIAVTALARGNVLPPEQAKEVYSHALMYAFMAESEPRLRAESLQCRLAVQWAYESLPGMAVQSNVAISLAARLEALHVQHPDTLQRMAQTYLRSADFAHACELCENAWRSGHATPALLATWQEACRQWDTVSTPPEQLVVRQQTMRQLSIASAMR